MNCKIKLDENVVVIDPDKDFNLLLSMESQGLDVNIGCTVGVCEVCKLRVVEGMENLKEINEHLYELEDDEILPCCMRATGDVVLEKII